MKKYLFFLVSFCFIFVWLVSYEADKAWAQPDFTFHGQFRVNSYSDIRDEKDTIGDENRSASRLRWRPTIEVKMSESVSLHTQFNIGHINSNLDNACGGGSDCFKIRHAVIQANLFDSGITGVAGLVPLSDKFGDTLFSSDWDFNPLALAFLGNKGDISWRAGLGKIQENTEGGGAASPSDDLDIYIFDADYTPLGLGGSVYWMHGGNDRTSAAGSKAAMAGGGTSQELDLVIYGGRYSRDYEYMKVNAFIVGSHLNAKEFFGVGANDLTSDGWAGKLEAKFPVQNMTLGIMGIYASGDKNFGVAGTGDASAFITPMSIAGSTGYWGYTGRLTEQGPTDTGIDDHTVNLDGGGLPWSSYANLGYGLWTIQGNLGVPVNDKLSAYFGIGYYASAETPAGQDDSIGTDLYAQGKLNLGKALNLEFGIDYAILAKGHYNNVTASKSRDITTLFSRLQLEY